MCIINNVFLYVGRKLSDILFIFAVDMKLQELLRKCDFDRMFEYIVKFHPKSEGSRFSYLVAYELLYNMEEEEGREYDIVPNPYAKESEGPASEITVWCSDLEGCKVNTVVRRPSLSMRFSNGRRPSSCWSATISISRFTPS